VRILARRRLRSVGLLIFSTQRLRQLGDIAGDPSHFSGTESVWLFDLDQCGPIAHGLNVKN
jgi:hypothetical protein